MTVVSDGNQMPDGSQLSPVAVVYLMLAFSGGSQLFLMVVCL